MIIDFNNDIELLSTKIDTYITELHIEKKDKFFSLKDPLTIITPNLYIPFGIEKYYTNYILKLQLRNFKTDKIILFERLIIGIENKLNDLLDNNLVSNMKYSNKYDPLLTIKLLQNKNVFTCNAAYKNAKDEPLNILDIKAKQYCLCDIIIDTIWKYNDKYYYKIKLKNLFL
jgi:hypothetical protein